MAAKKKKSKFKEEKAKRSKEGEAMRAFPQAVAKAEKRAPRGAKPPIEVAGGTSTDNAILDAAIVCAAEHGLSGMTTRRIAALAGVNEVTLFRRFGNKETLLNALFQREARLWASPALAYSGDLATDLRQMVGVIGGTANERRTMMILMLDAMQRGDLPAGSIHAISSEQRQILARYMQKGELRTETPENALAALLGPVLFGALVQSDASSSLDVEAHVQGFLKGRRLKANEQ